jgi:hypothetical protein
MTYETEMFNLFTDQCREVYKGRGRFGIVSLWLRTLSDVVVTVIREHLSDPHAKVGLLDAAPHAPLPWKGVMLVLIPGLIFFVSQIEQVTSSHDWFFMVFYRGAYFLILPVLLVWVLTRRFPVWGLIPLGLLYGTLWNYIQRPHFEDLPILGMNDTDVLFVTSAEIYIGVYEAKLMLVVFMSMILASVLIWHHAHRGLISRSAWKWLGLYGLLVVLGIAGGFYRFLSQGTLNEVKQIVFQVSLGDLYQFFPFLLLVFIGLFFARKYGGFSFLVILGYLLPNIIFGRYGDWSGFVPFYVVSLAVLAYRFVVALVAPVWLVRAASIPGRQRAAAIPVAIAILCHLFLNLVIYLAVDGPYRFSTGLLEFVLYIWDQLVIATGLCLAVALYFPRERDESIASPPELFVTAE